MNFSWFFAQKIAWDSKGSPSLSQKIVRIGQIAVALGTIVALITLSTGFGAKKEIKEKLADFNGHITIQPYNTNLSYNSDSIALPQKYYPHFSLTEIQHIQATATKSGIIRTEKSFDGVLLKGMDKNFDKDRFQKFILKGQIPDFSQNEISSRVLISQKLANNFYLDIDSTFNMVFLNEKQLNAQPIYRKFTVNGIYTTDISEFDDLYVIGDIRQVQKLNGWGEDFVGGFELFVKNINGDLEQIKAHINKEIGYNQIAAAATDQFPAINEWISIFDTNIFIILFIMMIVVVINMIMVILILILERTSAIGILKTLGANNRQIMRIFVHQALFIMIPGLVAGNLMALGLLLIQNYFGVIQLPPENYFISKAPVYLSWEIFLLVNLGTIIITALVLYLPSLLIRKISPNKAIKISG
ncbi:Outer membrane-specific lipoprotein transporter subunit LolE [Candidatus Ornithobacterium hominis]|uniref:ABC transporter permease n=1 Tax=Candidatus Ornithobacterium hominis TaxID=2497989 RepID=UPI0024BCFD6B|nr:FtsX-like permease family protein [Candidatus Ornithobacterium hominis]CAI9428877.1 Outer membrane-specific lipoprotein transporter subunit LolE [Candidatus Ornithobacterium hominis]